MELSALRARVLDRLARELPDDVVFADAARRRPALVAGAERLLAEESMLLDARERAALAHELADELAGFGPLEALLRDPDVTDVLVNGPGTVLVERSGELAETRIHLDAATIEAVVQRAVAPLGLRFDRAAPFVDARLPDGSRLHAIGPPVSLSGIAVTIRRFPTRRFSLETLRAAGTFDARAVELLGDAVRARHAILVSGATGAGKTTLLAALAGEIPPAERVVTIEESAELALTGHVISLEARPANAEGVGRVSVRDLVRQALRMRPDRIIVGEVRGGEALDLLQALHTGHAGSLATIHANDPADALSRLETLALYAGAGVPAAAIRRQVATGVDLVVHLARIAGRRVATAFTEVGGIEVSGEVGLRHLWP